MRAARNRAERNAAALAIIIALAVAALYARTAGFEYVFDDITFIVTNPGIAKGLTSEGLRWAFATSYHANWHPLAWISHLADRALFGPGPGPAHAVNAAAHAACAALLLVTLRRMTGALWPCAFVAAAFALHPLRVESVAWVTERKDALSTIFWILSLGAYARYARRPGPGRYTLVAALLSLGLMTKAMVVTLPFALLLLDWWPLNRMKAGSAGPTARALSPSRLPRLVLEKIPLLLLAAAAAAVTIISQRSTGAVQSIETYPIDVRIANALDSWVAYLADSFWPANLAVFYPHPGNGLAAWRVLVAALVLIAITILALRVARAAPAVLTGWLWYLGTLAPVIGIIQTGAQARADRYTYLPSIGLLVAISFGTARLAVFRHWRPAVLVPSALAILGALTAASWRQIGYWRDDLTLYTRALAVTNGNWMMLNNHGNALMRQGDAAGALRSYQAALQVRPHFKNAHFNLGHAFARLGRVAEAEAEYRAALAIDPTLVDADLALGALFADSGRRPAAIEHYRSVLRARPDLVILRMNLANMLSDAGRYTEALEHYAEAQRLAPANALIRANRGVTYLQMGKKAQAASDFREALLLDPANPISRRGLQSLETAQPR